ncbi:MAG: hypothetical protein O7D30_07860 [Rickettsia endosymbiont of Ixodes persulcatus]|nr:hypothetical protein [Rickettsia endosymbiont of Ixodes persulcatus]
MLIYAKFIYLFIYLFTSKGPQGALHRGGTWNVIIVVEYCNCMKI